MRARILAVVALVDVLFLLAACGKSATTSGASPTPTLSASPSATSSPSPTPSLSPTPSPSVTPPAAASPTVVVHTATATVSGKAETVLTTAQGLTLYYRTPDTATSITCTGACAGAWPPLLLSSGTPTGSPSLPGTLTVLAGPNGRQVLYQGHPLYRFVSDTGPGQVKGQGINSFLVATVGLSGM